MLPNHELRNYFEKLNAVVNSMQIYIYNIYNILHETEVD